MPIIARKSGTIFREDSLERYRNLAYRIDPDSGFPEFDSNARFVMAMGEVFRSWMLDIP